MRGRRGWVTWVTTAMGGLVMLVGCAESGQDEAGVTRTTTGETTSTVPVTVPPLTATTTHDNTTTTTTPEVTVAPPAPVFVDGRPQVVVTPSRGVVGTRVEVDGYGFEGRWQAGGTLWLGQPDDQECGLLAVLDDDVVPAGDGHLTGSFVVPETGVCRASPDRVVNLAGGTFDLLFRCNTDCRIGSFTVILPGESTDEPTGVRCDGVVFFGPGEDAAGDIYADGLSCDDAKSFLRAHAEPTGALNGIAHIEAEGFSCDRTGQSDVHLPRANYKCTRGLQTISFIRT